MTLDKTSLLRGCAIVALCTIASPALAQTTAPAPAPLPTGTGTLAATPAPTPSAQDADNNTSDIIVTASATAGGVKKMDASFSAVSLDQEALKSSGLTASADVLKASPGVFIESSGGPGAGANIEVVGFPSNSLSPYATFQLNGSSLFPMAGQTYLDGDLWLRPDDTIQRVELVQGGPGVLYGDGQPGLTANYILKRGTDKTTGSLGVSYGTENYVRVDGFLSGPVIKSAGINGTIGGYWNQGDGIRNPQFPADKGGQLTATLSKKWSTGSGLLYVRYVDLSDEFVTDTPITLNPDGSFSPFPGFSPLTGTMSSKANQILNIPISPCTGTGCLPGTRRIDQEDGRGVQTITFGGELHQDFGRIEFVDNLNVNLGVAHMSALYSSPVNPQSLSTFVNARIASNKLTGITGVNAYFTSDGSVAPLDTNIMEAEVRSMRQRFYSVSNELHLSYELFPGNTLTVGNRTAFYGVDLLLYTGSNILLQAKNNPSQVQVSLTNGVNTWQLTNSQGFVNGPTVAQHNTGNALNSAFFASDSWRFGGFLLDFGVREEIQDFDEDVQTSASTNLTGNALNLWGTGKYLTAGSTRYKYDRSALSWTVGLNYTFAPSFSAYLRANKGVHFLSFSDVTGLPVNNYGPTQKAYNYQGGIKFNSSFLYADISGFYRTFRNVPVQITGIPIPGTTTTGIGTIVYGSNTYGLQYSLVLTPFNGFTLSAMGDWAIGKYTQSDGCIFYTGVTPPVTYCVAADNFTGKRLARQPEFQTRISPAYKLNTNWGSVKVWGNFEYVGNRWSDMLQAQALPHYYDVSAGIQTTIGDRWEFTISGTNLTNQIGVTEENPRVAFGSGVPAPGTQLARSIDGREVLFQDKFKF